MTNQLNRRKFFKNTAITTAGFMLSNNMTLGFPEKKEVQAENLMQELLKYRKVDVHAHIGFNEGDTEKLLDFANRLGIEKICISRPVTNFSGKEPEDPDQVIKNNNIIIEALKKYPDRFTGYLTLNPRYPKKSHEEFKRCVDNGLTDYKGYTQVKINDPLYYTFIEKFIDHKMIIMMHAFCQLGMGGYRMKYDIGKDLHSSTPEDFVEISKRYPEAIFQFAHIGGGGDWEYECKALKDCPNVYVDTSGSNNEENIIDFAVKYLGEDRLLFATDNSFYQGVGKIMTSNLSENQKRKIFSENYHHILKKLGRNVN
ncbi:hypothetical protein BH23BAC1_BH23BAC1_43360 [soil metagenome]